MGASFLLLLLLVHFVDNFLFGISQLLVLLDGLHEDETPLLELLVALVRDQYDFGFGVVLVPDFEVSCALVENALPYHTLAKVGDEARRHRVFVLLVLEDRVSDLGVAVDPFRLALDFDFAFDTLARDLEQLVLHLRILFIK